MIEPRIPIFQWGQKVTTAVDLFNDGTFPDSEPEALLVAAGSEGEIVQVGFHEEAKIPIYLVEFANGYVVGCLEEEIGSEQAVSQIAGIL